MKRTAMATTLRIPVVLLGVMGFSLIAGAKPPTEDRAAWRGHPVEVAAAAQTPSADTTVAALNLTCASAATLACNSSVTFNNSTVVNVPNPPFLCTDASGPPNGTLWYKFTATATSARINTCNSLAPDSTFAVYDSCGTPVQIGRGEDGCGAGGYLGEECLGGLTIGQTYYVQISAWSAATRGSYTLELQCPCPAAQSNTVCTQAQQIQCNSTVTFSNAGLGHSPLPCYSCGTGNLQTGTLWYEFTAANPYAWISTCTSTAADSTLALYAGSCPALTEIGCSEDACGPSTFLSSVAASPLVVGNTYHIQVSAWQPADQGTYSLTLLCSDSPAGVPTMSAWGFAALIVLVLAAGAVVLRFRRRCDSSRAGQ